MKKSYLSALFLLVAAPMNAATFQVLSPSGEVSVTLNDEGPGLTYQLSRGGAALTQPSLLMFSKESQHEVVGSQHEAIDETWKTVWGEESEVRDHCQQLVLNLRVEKRPVTLLCRAYDDGVAFRFLAPATEEFGERVVHDVFEFQPTEDHHCYGTQGETNPFGPIKLSTMNGKRAQSAPLVMETSAGQWLALLESDLYSAKAFDRAIGYTVSPDPLRVLAQTQVRSGKESLQSPWKVILLGDSPGDLLNSRIALNLAAPSELGEASWVEAGVGLWDWRAHGYDNGQFKYGIDTQSYLRMIDFCEKQGLEYFTIDDYWFTVADDGSLITVPEVDLPRVMAYAKEKGVKIILYYDRKKAAGKPLIPDAELLSYYRELGADGVKYGFMGNKVDFTRRVIDLAAENELLIFFHDGPVPMTGVRRTMPNLISRENCHAQQDSRRAFSPTGFLKMAMINALLGPLDQANGNFGIAGINAGERKKGPKKKNSYVSTVTSEVARCLIIHSGLVTLPDAPEEYEKKEDLFSFLKAMPATWDESVVLESEMGRYLTTARRSGDTWFVGSVTNEKSRDLSLALDFLPVGASYQATVYVDGPEAHGRDNPESYTITTKTLSAGEEVAAHLAPGGGFAMILRPQE